MRRTNIYLADDQCSTLDGLARSSRISRAELIRRLIDQAIASELHDTESDVMAIEESFGALADDAVAFDRGVDGRMRYLEGTADA